MWLSGLNLALIERADEQRGTAASNRSVNSDHVLSGLLVEKGNAARLLDVQQLARVARVTADTKAELGPLVNDSLGSLELEQRRARVGVTYLCRQPHSQRCVT